MKAFHHLASLDGVLAAGEFSPHSEHFDYAGLLEPKQARMAAVMCRSNSESVSMQTDLIASYAAEAAAPSPRGWFVTSDHFTVCVVGSLFCFIDNAAGSLNQVMDAMEQHSPESPS